MSKKLGSRAWGGGGATIAILLLACGGSGSSARRAHQPPPIPAGLGRPAIEWLRGVSPTERVLVGEGGIASGPAGGTLGFASFPGPDEADDLRFFAGTFAPFAEVVAGERFTFAGRGGTAASPPERRMIREWTRKAAADAAVGVGGAFGLALAWRGGALACDGVSIFLSGEVRAGACDWRQEVRGRLAAEPLARLYRWFDRYRPFQVDALDTGRASSAAIGVIFAGRGPLDAPADERMAMSDLSAVLHRELAARRAASLAPPPAVQPAPPGSQADAQAIARRPPAPAPPAPIASGLLRPDLPPPTPATTPIIPVPVQPAPAAPETTAVDRATTAPPARSKEPAPRRERAQEEDEAPMQGTEPGPSN